MISISSECIFVRLELFGNDRTKSGSIRDELELFVSDLDKTGTIGGGSKSNWDYLELLSFAKYGTIWAQSGEDLRQFGIVLDKTGITCDLI